MLAPALLDSEKGEKKEKKLAIIIPIIIISITIPKSTTATNIQIHHLNTRFMCPRSIAGVAFDSVGRFRVALLLRPTSKVVCVPDVIGGLAMWRHNNPKTKKLECLNSARTSTSRRIAFPQIQRPR